MNQLASQESADLKPVDLDLHGFFFVFLKKQEISWGSMVKVNVLF